MWCTFEHPGVKSKPLFWPMSHFGSYKHLHLHPGVKQDFVALSVFKKWFYCERNVQSKETLNILSKVYLGSQQSGHKMCCCTVTRQELAHESVSDGNDGCSLWSGFTTKIQMLTNGSWCLFKLTCWQCFCDGEAEPPEACVWANVWLCVTLMPISAHVFSVCVPVFDIHLSLSVD